MQTKIPCMLMRGGTSKGPFFDAADLPEDVATRDAVLLAVMGSPDNRQINGIGGADTLTSKVGIVSRSTKPGVDLDFLFAQVLLDEARVDTSPNCGNMLAAVVPFALETGMVQATGETTTLRVLTLNTGMLADITVQTPGKLLTYEGEAKIDGCPGTSAPITIDFLDIAGSVCGSLLPTGRVLDEIDGVKVTLIDNGMPVMILSAESVGATGYETRDELNADAALKARIEAIRLKAGPMMNLGDVSKRVVPKVTLLAKAQGGGNVATRTFIPHNCHASIGVLGAVTVATACVLPGSVAAPYTTLPEGASKRISVEHPTGEFTVQLEVEGPAEAPEVKRAGLLRTARALMEGRVLISPRIWDGKRQTLAAAAE